MGLSLNANQCSVEFTNISAGKIPDSIYFSKPGISNSKLKYIDPLEDGSPEKYTNGIPFKYDPSLELGSSIHEQFLSSDEYKLSNYEGKPSAKKGYFIDCFYKFRKEGKPIYECISLASAKADYYSGKMSMNRFRSVVKDGLDYYLRLSRGEFTDPKKEVRVLPKAQLESCKAALQSLHSNKSIQQLLSENSLIPKQFLNEFAFFVDLNIKLSNGQSITLPFKGKADSIIIDHENKVIYLNDLKTTSKPCETFMGGLYEGVWYNGSMQKLHYMRQFSVYLMMLQMYCEQILGLTDYNYRCNVIVVETTGNNKAKMFPINNSYIQYGAKEFKELICRVAFHELNGYDKTIEWNN